MLSHALHKNDIKRLILTEMEQCFVLSKRQKGIKTAALSFNTLYSSIP